MRITYEATDPVIEFGPIEKSYWTTVWMDGPTAGHGGPSNAHADTGTPSAYRRTTHVGATMSLEFYGVVFIFRLAIRQSLTHILIQMHRDGHQNIRR